MARVHRDRKMRKNTFNFIVYTRQKRDLNLMQDYCGGIDEAYIMMKDKSVILRKK